MKALLFVISLLAITSNNLGAQDVAKTCQCPSAIKAVAFGQTFTSTTVQCEEGGEISRIPGYAYSSPSYAYTVIANMDDGSTLRIELELWDEESCETQEYGYSFSQAQFIGSDYWWFYSTWLPTKPDGTPTKRITYPGYTGWVEGMKNYELKLTIDW